MCVLQQGPGSGPSLPLERSPLWGVLHVVEGLALVVLCSCRPATRRLAVNVLKEVRALHTALGIAKVTTNSLIDWDLKVTKMRCSVSQVRCKRLTFMVSVCRSQGDEELAIDVMDRQSASVLESFIHLTGADQVRMAKLLFNTARTHPDPPLSPADQPAILPQWYRPADAGRLELISHQPPI